MSASLWSMVLLATATVAHASPSSSPSAANDGLPIVDLGYQRHKAISFNETGQYYTFSNIRYAAPPTGENRFRAPQPPSCAANRAVQTGETDCICPQAESWWSLLAAQWLPLFLTGQTSFNQSEFVFATSDSVDVSPATPDETEDCLFLDVVAPQQIFESRGKGRGAPVLVWIHGGGYANGHKNSYGNPAGLLARSANHGSRGVIYVSINYRLGAFGFLSGPSFQTNGTPNAGLYDQRFALEWVQKHIRKFGGDPRRVTVAGQSAGGGSIMHHITAFGGMGGPPPFHKAIPQSPAWQLMVSNQQQEIIFRDFLDQANVSSLADLRAASSEVLSLANRRQVLSAPYGGFIFGPTVDGHLVPQPPGLLLLHGHFHRNIDLLIGHNAEEGLLFTNPFIQTEEDMLANLDISLPSSRAWPRVQDNILTNLYPPVYDGSQNYTSVVARAAALVGESTFTCNNIYLERAFAGRTYAYVYAIDPALHGADASSTFFNGETANIDTRAEIDVAVALQEYITSFADDGNPNEAGVPFFPLSGPNATVQTLSLAGISQMMDEAATDRCRFWQRALYV